MCQSHQDPLWVQPPGLAHGTKGTTNTTQAQQETSKGTPGTGTPDCDPAEWTKLSETSGEPQHRGSDGTAENVMLQIWAGTKQEFWKRGIE